VTGLRADGSAGQLHAKPDHCIMPMGCHSAKTEPGC
jgi:hypothetical protein